MQPRQCKSFRQVFGGFFVFFLKKANIWVAGWGQGRAPPGCWTCSVRVQGTSSTDVLFFIKKKGVKSLYFIVLYLHNTKMTLTARLQLLFSIKLQNSWRHWNGCKTPINVSFHHVLFYVHVFVTGQNQTLGAAPRPQGRQKQSVDLLAILNEQQHKQYATSEEQQ